MAKRVDRKAVILESEVRAIKRALRKHHKVQPILDRLSTTFKSYEPNKVAQAEAEYGRDGEIEVDEGAVCSRGEDAGCYVQAWLWVYDAEDALREQPSPWAQIDDDDLNKVVEIWKRQGER